MSALITGASSGLGRELAIRFSGMTEPGTIGLRTFSERHVILSGRNEKELENTRRLCSDPANTTLVSGDLREPETIQRLAASADLYSIRYLICSAGVYYQGPFEGNSDKQDRLISNNCAHIPLIHTCLPTLTRTKGSIVHINSVAGKNLAPGEALYSASKHAMRAFLASFRFEAREKGVRVLDAFPGAIKTPMLADDKPGMNAAELADVLYNLIIHESTTLQIEDVTFGRFSGR